MWRYIERFLSNAALTLVPKTLFFLSPLSLPYLLSFSLYASFSNEFSKILSTAFVQNTASGPSEGLRLLDEQTDKGRLQFSRIESPVRGAVNPASGVLVEAPRASQFFFAILQHPRWLEIKLPTKLIYSWIKFDRITSKKIKILETFLPIKLFIVYLYQKEKRAH